jgi:hypothetical protein
VDVAVAWADHASAGNDCGECQRHEARARRAQLPRTTAPFINVLQFFLRASNLIVGGLAAVGSGAEAQRARYARHTRLMQNLMASLYGCEYLIPLAFYISAIGVEVRLQSGFLQYAMTVRDLFGH